MTKKNYTDLISKVNKWTTKATNASNAAKGDNYEHYEALEKGYGLMVEELCAGFEIKVDWPGLEPRFNWKGKDYNTIENLVYWMKAEDNEKKT